MLPTPQEGLQQAFQQISRSRNQADLAAADKAFRTAFLAFGSETECNLEAVKAVSVKEFDPEHDFGYGGLALTKFGEPLSSILNSAEGCEMPSQIQTDFPGLKQAEWKAALRVATMALLAFEADLPKSIELR